MSNIVLPIALQLGLDGGMRVMKNLPRWVAMIVVVASPHLAAATDIETEDGRRFSHCTVLKADGIGLYFRHRSGIARVLYDDLSDDLLAKLEPLPEPEEIDVKKPSTASAPQGGNDRPTAQANGEFRMVFWQRVVIGVPHQALHHAPYGCPTSGLTGAHRYSHFGWRQAVERDFLITTGILPRPLGVITHRVPQGIRLNYF